MDISFADLASTLCEQARLERRRIARWEARGHGCNFPALRLRIDRIEAAAALLMGLALDEVEVRAISRRRTGEAVNPPGTPAA
jgi:hypothetical protein